MPGLFYVGAPPAADRDVSTKLSIDTELASGVSRSYVDGRVDALAAAKATKVYTDTQDAAYVPGSYYTARDALLVPLTSKGAAGGVATLNGSGLLPAAQTPVLGGGILAGPYGHTASFDVTGATTTPQKIADFPSGPTGINGRLLVFMTVIATSTGAGRPVVEVRYSTTGDTTYAGQTLCAIGYGRSQYSDAQTVTVMPATASPNAMQDGVQVTISGAVNLRVTAWIYDGAGGQTSTLAGYVLSAALFYARTAL
jgi:hypothetical protein